MKSTTHEPADATVYPHSVKMNFVIAI